MARYKLLELKEVAERISTPFETLKTHYYHPERRPKNLRWIPEPVTLPNGKKRWREDQIDQWIEEGGAVPTSAPKAPNRRTG